MEPLFFAELLVPDAPAPSRVSPPRRRGIDAEWTRIAAALLRGLPGGQALAARVVVRWSRRLSSTAGQAHPSQAMVTLNPRLAEFPGEVERTLRHELAHLLAYSQAAARAVGGRRARIAPHGPEWRQACVALGIAGEARCHRLALPRRQLARKHLYRCPGCLVELRRVRPIGKKRPLACLRCCNKYAGGRFDRRFRFVEIVPSPGP